MSTRFGNRQSKILELGYSDFQAGLPITAFTEKHSFHKETERAAYEIGWRAAKEDGESAKTASSIIGSNDIMQVIFDSMIVSPESRHSRYDWICALTGIGSTSAKDLCRLYKYDPDEKITFGMGS